MSGNGARTLFEFQDRVRTNRYSEHA